MRKALKKNTISKAKSRLSKIDREVLKAVKMAGKNQSVIFRTIAMQGQAPLAIWGQDSIPDSLYSASRPMDIVCYTTRNADALVGDYPLE